MIFLLGIRIIRSQPFPLEVGTGANLTCVDDVDTASLMQWQSEDGRVLASEDGRVLASANSTNVLNLPLAPVNDSGSLHNRIFTCLVTRNRTIFNQATSVQVYGMFFVGRHSF